MLSYFEAICCSITPPEKKAVRWYIIYTWSCFNIKQTFSFKKEIFNIWKEHEVSKEFSKVLRWVFNIDWFGIIKYLMV